MEQQQQQATAAKTYFSIFPFNTPPYIASAETFLKSHLDGMITDEESPKVTRTVMQSEYSLQLLSLLIQRPLPVDCTRRAHAVGVCTHFYDTLFDQYDLNISTTAALEMLVKLAHNDFRQIIPTHQGLSPNLVASMFIAQKLVPYEKNPAFWHCFKMLHLIQTISLLQRENGRKQPSLQELQIIAEVKGGLSALLAASLLIPDMAQYVQPLVLPENLDLQTLLLHHRTVDAFYKAGINPLADAIFLVGGTIQLVDDYRDREDDRKNGIVTEMTRSRFPTALVLRRIPGRLTRVRHLLHGAGVPPYILQDVSRTALQYLAYNASELAHVLS